MEIFLYRIAPSSRSLDGPTVNLRWLHLYILWYFHAQSQFHNILPWPQPHPLLYLTYELEHWLWARSYQWPTSLMLLWLNGSKSMQPASKIWWKTSWKAYRKLLYQHSNAHYVRMTCSAGTLCDVQGSTFCQNALKKLKPMIWLYFIWYYFLGGGLKVLFITINPFEKKKKCP